MAAHARLLLALCSLIAAAGGMAHADDQGHCLKIYADTSAELVRKAGVDASADSTITKVGAAGLAATAAVSLVKGRWMGAAATGVLAAGVYALNYFSKERAEIVDNHPRKYVLDTTGLQRDAALIYLTYNDVLGGETNSEPAQKVMQDVAVDKQDEDKVLAHLVEAMEDGTLCEGNRPKPLGTIYAELKNFEQTKVRGVY